MNKDNAHLYLPLVQALVDGKTVQASVPPDWVDIDDMDLGREPSDYRIKPWSLSRHLPGFRPLRDGEEYHRQDWTEEMLPEGWRPLLKGERVVDGARNDEYRLNLIHDKKFDWQTTWIGRPLPEASPGFWRTRRPLPEPPKLIPLEPSDWMKDGPWWVREVGSDEAHLVHGVSAHGIRWRVHSCGHGVAMDKERSNDGINWSPCSKEAACSPS
jgi:hypothetical protein